jgi:hypothetical protein
MGLPDWREAAYTTRLDLIRQESEMDIQTGSQITIEITQTPTRAAAIKTLHRICSKDAGIAKAQRHRKAHRPSWQDWIRGGKYWHHQMKSRPLTRIEPGRKYSVKATFDVIRDLGRVQAWTKITAD